ncbi:Bug family tripartite tricarboxylate transporter substrate binding protein [Bordetella hinzii]|uniref:Tripartite tricarboxylate transporter family receptor n=1 Tax=Bordetella hinzii OH87 BAL007II TaxID=1331262 RepID=A0ABR4R530_9BORD|nr:tripartite tricarboxylate transporter substrate binding protein [Bordetella hinzii]KCB25527.1 tripartite tricarboxylate transporter family receptor [Bordetella hinzii OH87 BAL007II]KCB44817.1 tripartite tricarboxylate transporter family receptor [Bordetella hinzii 5132]QDJ43072.1 tripartite tricarboxylate transporter substrate binding protein [Bordetella hinzii]QDJ47644.1 tripartite tricarboxylate transporter substrate binding protein [Bordetella hinzii]QDJ56554.1 tripartite tricarboxylate 
MKLPRILAALCLAMTAMGQPAAADTYPSKPITLVVPFPAGSGTDAVGRIFALELGNRLGQQIVVENKPGANATIAANYVARAKPDGYTLFVTTNTSHSAAPFLMKQVPYDPVKDFTAIARGGNLPFILVTNPKRPYKTVQELVDYARKHPGKVTYASGNSTGIVAGATLARRAGIDILHVPYKGTPQAMTDVVGGQVDFMFTDLASGLPFVQSGQLRALAVSTAERSAIVPGLPSMKEAGVADFDLNSWNGYFGPAGLPPAIVTRLNAAINDIVRDPAVKQKLAGLGFDAFSGTPQDFAAFVAAQRDLWGKLIHDADIEAQ